MITIDKSLDELEEIFIALRSKLNELNRDAVRNKKYDFHMMNEKWLQQVLKGNLKLKEKESLLLTQIGYLRINIFTEYLERVNLLREKRQLKKAVELMNIYAEIASIFISTKNQSTTIKRLKKLFSARSAEPIDYLQQWQVGYDAWLQQNANQLEADEKNLLEKFDQLKKVFIELYTFSFSADNFPPLRYRRTDR